MLPPLKFSSYRGICAYTGNRCAKVNYIYEMKTFRNILALTILLMPSSSFAWGVLGHRVIGGIAEKYLSPNTKKEIKKLLGYETIAMASNWADFIKSDNSYNYLSTWHYINLPSGLSAKPVEPIP